MVEPVKMLMGFQRDQWRDTLKEHTAVLTDTLKLAMTEVFKAMKDEMHALRTETLKDQRELKDEMLKAIRGMNVKIDDASASVNSTIVRSSARVATESMEYLKLLQASAFLLRALAFAELPNDYGAASCPIWDDHTNVAVTGSQDLRDANVCINIKVLWIMSYHLLECLHPMGNKDAGPSEWGVQKVMSIYQIPLTKKNASRGCPRGSYSNTCLYNAVAAGVFGSCTEIDSSTKQILSGPFAGLNPGEKGYPLTPEQRLALWDWICQSAQEGVNVRSMPIPPGVSIFIPLTGKRTMTDSSTVVISYANLLAFIKNFSPITDDALTPYQLPGWETIKEKVRSNWGKWPEILRDPLQNHDCYVKPLDLCKEGESCMPSLYHARQVLGQLRNDLLHHWHTAGGSDSQDNVFLPPNRRESVISISEERILAELREQHKKAQLQQRTSRPSTLRSILKRKRNDNEESEEMEGLHTKPTVHKPEPSTLPRSPIPSPDTLMDEDELLNESQSSTEARAVCSALAQLGSRGPSPYLDPPSPEFDADTPPPPPPAKKQKRAPIEKKAATTKNSKSTVTPSRSSSSSHFRIHSSATKYDHLKVQPLPPTLQPELQSLLTEVDWSNPFISTRRLLDSKNKPGQKHPHMPANELTYDVKFVFARESLAIKICCQMGKWRNGSSDNRDPAVVSEAIADEIFANIKKMSWFQALKNKKITVTEQTPDNVKIISNFSHPDPGQPGVPDANQLVLNKTMCTLTLKATKKRRGTRK